MRRYQKANTNRYTKLEEVFKYIISTTFLPYQLDWLTDESKFKIYLKSRQIGISEIIAFEAFKNVLIKNENQYFVSASQRQSIELLDKFANWVSIFTDLGIDLKIDSQSKTEIRLNNCDVKSLTSNAVTSQGFSGSVFLDEMALYPNDKEIYNALLPTITLGGSLKLISRPAGDNLFKEIWEDTVKYKRYSRHVTDINEAVKQGLQVDIQLLRDVTTDEETFAEQYECTFVDSKSSYLPYELLKTCYADIKTDLTGDSYITIDVGRSNDRTAIVVFIKDTAGVFNVVEYEELHKTGFSEQQKVIGKYIGRFKPLKVLIDKGFNPQLYENLNTKYNGVYGIHMGNDTQLKCFTGLKKLFEDKRIRIPANEDMITQLHSVRRETEGGKVRFTAPRNARGHSDIAYSMALIGEILQSKREPRAWLYRHAS